MKLVCNRPAEVIKHSLNTVDFVCTDLDECLFPFFTQVLVSGQILFESFFKRFQRGYIPQLIGGIVTVCWLLLITGGNIKRVGNVRLMKYYERAMQGIPRDLIEKHSLYIHSFFYDHALTFLHYFAEQHIPIAVVSLSIQPILDVLHKNLGFSNGCVGNGVVFDEFDRFSQYVKPLKIGGSDKLVAFDTLVEMYNVKCPLVIGHSKEELPMVEKARAMGGVSIGINPKKDLRKAFDLVLYATNWLPLINFLNESDMTASHNEDIVV